MSPPDKENHWDALASDLGAKITPYPDPPEEVQPDGTPDEDAAIPAPPPETVVELTEDRPAEFLEDAPPTVDESPPLEVDEPETIETAQASEPAASPDPASLKSHWSGLADQLGIELPEEPPEVAIAPTSAELPEAVEEPRFEQPAAEEPADEAPPVREPEPRFEERKPQPFGAGIDLPAGSPSEVAGELDRVQPEEDTTDSFIEDIDDVIILDDEEEETDSFIEDVDDVVVLDDDEDETEPPSAEDLDAEQPETDEAETKAADEQGAKPRRRRRGRRRRKSSSKRTDTADDGQAPATGEESVREPTDADLIDEAPEDAETETPGEEEDRPKKRRRRRRPKSKRKDAAESPGDEADDADFEGAPAEDSETATPTDGESGDKADAATSRTSHRKIPSWQEAIGVIVTSNIESRAKSSDGGGRRGKGRGGKGKGGKSRRGAKSAKSTKGGKR